MKTTITITATQSEVNAFALDTFKSKYADSGINVSLVISADPVIPAPISVAPPAEKAASTAPIGQTIDGIEITHYGYPGDSSPDSNSMKGEGDTAVKLTPNVSVALTKSARQKLFGTEGHSTNKEFTLGGHTFRDNDTAPESNMRADVYDPFHQGRDEGCTDAMYAKSKAEMVAAGILTV